MGRSRRTGTERTTHGESLCKVSSDLSNMERGELRHGQRICYGLSACKRWVQTNRTRDRDVQPPYLSPGFSDFSKRIKKDRLSKGNKFDFSFIVEGDNIVFSPLHYENNLNIRGNFI